MSIPSSVNITSPSSTIPDSIATNSSTTTVKETTASNNLQLQAQQQHQHAVLHQQQQIQRQRLLEQQQQQQLQYHLQIQQRQQNTILLKQQQQQQNSQTSPIHPSSQQDQLPQQRQRNMLHQRIFQQQQGFPLPLSISFDQHQQSADQSPTMDGPPPLKRSRLMTMNHSGSSTPLTPLSADSPMFGMNNAAFSQPLYMDPQHYRLQQQQQQQAMASAAAATTVQSITPDQFAGNDFEWMTAAAVASELSSNGGLATPGSTPHSRSVAASDPVSSLPSPSMSSASTSTISSSASSTATTTTSAPVSVVVPSNITSSPVMHLTSSSSSISVSSSDKHPLESSSTTASPEMSEATIASEDSTSLPRRRTTRGSAPLPTPIHPLSTELHHPHAVVPSQNFHRFSQHHHALATPTSATAPTSPLPLPSSHHHQFQQQQQEDFNGLGLGLGLGLNLGFYDFMPMSQQQQPSTSSTSAPSTPNPSATATSNNTIPSPIPKAVMAHLQSSSNNSSPVTSHLPHPHPLGPPVLRSNDDSHSSASSPSMMDLTGMASGLEAVVASNSTFDRQSSLPHIHNSRIIKSMSSSTASSSASSSGIMTHSSKFASRGSFSASSVQTSPELDAAPHNVGEMDYEDGNGTPGAGEDDGQNTNEEDNEENSDDEDDDDDPENNRPAICPHCLKEFQSKGLLRSHIVSHSSDRPFVCRDCSDKSYKRNHDLLRHRREKHNVEGAVIPPRGSGRHSHSGASGSASKRSAALAGLGMGGDLMMSGGLMGFMGGMRNRNHRRSCSSAILGSGLGTRSSTTPYSMAHGHVHHHHPGMGLSEQYPSAVTVVSQQHQQQQNKIPSPHDLMFASPNAGASGMMYLNTNSLLSAVGGGNNNGSLSGTGLEFPHLSSMGPPLPLPSQKHQFHLQQQQSQPLSQVFGHHQFTHQQPQTQTQQVLQNNGRRTSHQHQLSQIPPPLQQYHNQHQHPLHPLQQPHPLSLQFQQQQQQQNAMLHQAPRLASQQPPSLDMNLGLSLGLGPLEMSSSTSANTLAEQQRRASAISLSSATSSSLSLSSTTASSVAETPLQRKRRLSDSDITTTTNNSGTTPTVVTMTMMTSSSSTPSTPSIASAPQVNSDGSIITTSSAEYIRDRTVSSSASVLMSQQPPFIPLISQGW
ncbi:hypothetical protein BKA57DRAFT_136010 [Linnemannia elongata]|nr:hypothetical protein BKA57DRAFT_136010 [Linnemannia elongata]